MLSPERFASRERMRQVNNIYSLVERWIRNVALFRFSNFMRGPGARHISITLPHSVLAPWHEGCMSIGSGISAGVMHECASIEKWLGKNPGPLSQKSW